MTAWARAFVVLIATALFLAALVLALRLVVELVA